MARVHKIMKRKIGGFTLIELIVVISIIGVLSLLVVANLNNTRRKGRDAKRKTDVKTIQAAVESYYGDNNAYPDVLTKLCVGGPCTGTVAYLPNLPHDPLCPTTCTGGWTDYTSNYHRCNASACSGPPSPADQGYRLYARLENTDDPEALILAIAPTGTASARVYSVCGGLFGSNADCTRL